MTTPSTTIYVRPGWASYIWTYAGAALPTGSTTSTCATSAIVAVAFDATGSLGEPLSRGNLQYSRDKGQTWLDYTAPSDAPGAWLPVSGLVWRFQDRNGSDSSPNTFGVHYQLADGSIVELDNTVIVDNVPASLVGRNDLMFSTMQTGALVDTLAAIDNGALTDARWTIDSQSHPGLFAIAYDPAVDTTARLVLADGNRLPVAGLSASVTVHYYDRFQLDASGNPIPGQGVSRTLSYVVEDGVAHSLAGFGSDVVLGAGRVPAWGGASADPALARLSTGGIVAVWQGTDTAGGGAGLRAQFLDAAGKPSGAGFALTPDGDARLEGQPAVAALSGGRFAVAYAVNDGDMRTIAYRVVGSNGAPGVEHVLADDAHGAAALPATPAITALADGSFALAWRSGGTVHVQGVTADGAPAGAQQHFTALGSAASPALAALPSPDGRGWVVSWGEMNDGNVYAATSTAGIASAPFVASGDGYAASVSTAAPLPHVAGLADGGFVVAWDSYVNAPYGFTHSDVFFQRYDAAGHALGTAVQANVDSFGGRYDAAVTALTDGSFLVAWQAGDGDGSGIVGRRFGLDGTAVDEREFALSAGRSGDQSGADVVGLAGGGFAAAWTDIGADGAVSVEARVLQGAAGVQGAAVQGMTAGLTFDSSVFAAEDVTPAVQPSPPAQPALMLGSALLIGVQQDGIDYLFGG